jgi:hypothetical protein
MRLAKKRRSDYVEIDENLLLQTYNECGRSLNKTAEKLETSSRLIRSRFKDYGLEYDAKIIYSLNHDYFDILDEHQMYWLGFLITDGCVMKHNYSYIIQLSLATKDVCILEWFKKDLEFTGPITNRIIKNEFKQDGVGKYLKQEYYYRSTIQLTSKKIFDRLGEFGIVPRKTYIVKFPEQLKNHPLLNHFIRGCIDGDGWTRLHTNKGKTEPDGCRIGFCGTEVFVKEMLNVIKSTLNLEGGRLEDRGGVNWLFEFETLHDVAKLTEWLYKDATIYLPRKYENVKDAQKFADRYTPYRPTKEELQTQYEKCGSILQTAKSEGVDPLTIKNRLVEFGIEHKTATDNAYNLLFFSDDNKSEKKYYWAGYLAGRSTFVEDDKYPYLAISSANKTIIENFIADSKMKLNVREIDNHHTRANKISYSTTIMNKDILAQLEKYNIDKNKWENYQIPKWLLVDIMLPHFLRGYFDARSGVQIYKDKFSFTIVNNKTFIEQIQNIFAKNINYKLTAKIKLNKRNYKIIYIRKQALAIWDWLYASATIYSTDRRAIYDLAVK